MSDFSTQLASALPQDTGSGPEWVKALRQSGAQNFRTHGLPTRKDEAWKYTGLTTMGQNGVQLATGSRSLVSEVSNPKPLAESGCQVDMLDGQFLEQIGNPQPGLTVLPLADALHQGIAGLQTLMESLPGPFALQLLIGSDSYFCNTSSACGNTFSNISHTISSVRHRFND